MGFSVENAGVIQGARRRPAQSGQGRPICSSETGFIYLFPGGEEGQKKFSERSHYIVENKGKRDIMAGKKHVLYAYFRTFWANVTELCRETALNARTLHGNYDEFEESLPHMPKARREVGVVATVSVFLTVATPLAPTGRDHTAQGNALGPTPRKGI